RTRHGRDQDGAAGAADARACARASPKPPQGGGFAPAAFGTLYPLPPPFRSRPLRRDRRDMRPRGIQTRRRSGSRPDADDREPGLRGPRRGDRTRLDSKPSSRTRGLPDAQAGHRAHGDGACLRREQSFEAARILSRRGRPDDAGALSNLPRGCAFDGNSLRLLLPFDERGVTERECRARTMFEADFISTDSMPGPARDDTGLRRAIVRTSAGPIEYFSAEIGR